MTMTVLAAASLGGFLSWLILKWVAQRGRARDVDPTPLADLAREFRVWEIGGVFLLALAIVLAWLGLLGLSRIYPRSLDSVAFRLTPHALYWGVLAFFVGNLLATGPTHLLYRWWMGADFDRFRAYQTRKFGFDSRRWMFPFYVIVGSLSGAVVALMLDWYVLIGGDGIEIDDLPTFQSRRYDYTRVLQIRSAPRFEGRDGSIREGFAVVLQFDDGHHWSSRRDPARSDEPQLRALVEYISERSTLPVVELSVLAHSEL